ncbi:MAG: DegT/DnrJ/EryC1/StrS family aminotransferase [Acidobacteria bacterium]|nr:DegT/DnrJ/EryC1/StrS family aminotransferase [Acidobacteriota bacterium]MBV9477815.1 DegT/DnrJ/EryC1/StrS family aminotransferase [Acidobacteriota bacterium]
MAIPLLDLKQQYAAIRDEALRVTAEIYESQLFILGKRVDDFERDFAAYCTTRHAVGVSSGTDALLEALMVLGVGPGDEVIVPAYSFFATAGVVARLGAIPVFVDITLDDYNLDPAQIEARITPRTKAIMPVHLYGQCAPMDEIMAIANARNIPVVEDAAQAVGADYRGKRAGAIGAMGAFSFFPSKNLGAFGDAGAITTNDDELAVKLIDYRVHGMRPKYFHHVVGGNFRIDALQAAMLHIKLPHLESWHDGRRRNAELYRRHFAATNAGERVVLPEELPGRRHIYNQFVIRFPEGSETRDRVMAHLKSVAIGCEVYYPLTLPQQECFRDVPGAHDAYPNSDAAAAQTLAIPIFPELTEAQIAEVVREIVQGLG